MKTKLFYGLLIFCIASWTHAQTTHTIDWEMGVGANASITIDVGDTIEWENTDSGIPHNVVSSDTNAPSGFGSGTLNGGDTYSFTFDDPVVFDYGCGFHPAMTGTITVIGDTETCDNPPENLSIDDITETSVEFSWDEPTNTDDIEGYGYRIMNSGDDPENDTPVHENMASVGISVIIVTDLDPGTDYDLYVVSICDLDTELFSDFVQESFSTEEEEEECEAPTNLIVDELTENSGTISWTEPGNTDNIESYAWVVVLSGETPDGENSISEGFTSPGTTTDDITGLEADTMYDAYLSSVCDLDNMIFSDSLMETFTTESLSIDENSFSNFRFYPNPASEKVHLDAPNNRMKTVEIFTLTGRRLISKQPNSNTLQLDITSIATGNYFMRVDFENGETKIVKLLKK